jgi:hypothetical protein
MVRNCRGLASIIIKGSFADIAQGLRSEESTYKAVLRGAREGVIEAFQWLKRLEDGGLGGGGIRYDGSAPMGRAHAGQRAILGGHVKAAAKAIRDKLSDGPNGVSDTDKGSYHKPGGAGGKRAGLGARYAQAMSVAEDQLAKLGVSKEHLRAAAAIMVGNASAESELIPSTVHDQGTGYGIYGARDPHGGAPTNYVVPTCSRGSRTTAMPGTA